LALRQKYMISAPLVSHETYWLTREGKGKIFFMVCISELSL
jgi:hypothetical protein